MKHIIFYLIISLILGACKTPHKHNISAPDSIYPLEQTQNIDNFDNYIDSMAIVHLEATPESFITYIKKILITENKDIIILNSTGILVFDHFGKFLRKIGSRGRGAEEYVALRDICLSNDYQQLLALDCTNQIITYNIDDGKFIKRTIIKMNDPDKQYLDFLEICPSNNNGFFLFCCNPPNLGDFNKEFYCLIEFDEDGKFIDKFLPRLDIVFPKDIISQSYNNDYIIRPQEGDNICYKITDNGLIPFLALDFKDKYIPRNHVFPKPGEGYPIQEYMTSKYYKLPIYIHDTPNHLYFGCCDPNGQDIYFLFSLKNHKGIRWQNDPNEDEILLIGASDSTFFYGVYSDYSNYTIQERQIMKNPLKKYILSQKNINLTNDQQNPVLIKIKFKL